MKKSREDQNEQQGNGVHLNRRHFMIASALAGLSIGALHLPACGRKKAVVNKSADTTDADFILIGAGHNSLSCAMLLSQAGYQVLVLEGENEIGGAAKTAEITLPGFKHDLYAANIGLFLGSPLFQEFKDDLFKNGFKPVVNGFPMASVFPDQTGMAVYQDAAQTMDSFKQFSSHDATAWTELYDYFNKTAPLFLPLLQKPMPSFAALKQAWQLVRTLGTEGAYELAGLLLKSPREFAEYWFEHPKSRALILPWAMHLDFGPDVSGGATFPFVEPPIYHTFGMPLSEGGVSTMIQSMAQIVEKNGGRIQTGKRIDNILVQKGQAVGVSTHDGTNIFSRRSIIANVTPHQLVKKLIDPRDLPSPYVKKSEKFRFGPGTMMIHLALNGPVEWAAGAEYGKFNYVHIAPYLPDLANTYTDAVNGALPASPLLVVGQLSVSDPSRTPKGKHLLWVQVRLLPRTPMADAVTGPGAISPGPWSEIKEKYADRVLQKLEAYAPGITGKILKRVVLSPADLEKNNPNLVGGDSLAGSHHLDQFYMFRPFAGWSRYETPIAGLYMVGASTWPGAGLHGTSGYLLGKDLMKLYG